MSHPPLRCLAITAIFQGLFVCVAVAAGADRAGPVGHWKLLDNCRDYSGNGNHGVNRGVVFRGVEGATFDGRSAHIEIPHGESLAVGRGDFSIALWAHIDAKQTDILGDIAGKYDRAARRGFNFAFLDAAGAVTSQSNHRNLFFGVNAGKTGKWIDCGRPGNNMFIYAMAVFNGDLYVGTWEPAEGQAGHVYRYAGGTNWIDCGAPDQCNAISALCEHDGKLYAGSSFYNGQGSALPESPNKNPGGKVFRYEGGTKWTDCGKIGDFYTATAMVSFDGNLYAAPCDSYGCPNRTAACFRYEGGQSWKSVGAPEGRISGLLVQDGAMQATVFGGRKVGFARYDGGEKWTTLGVPPDTDQTYSAVIYRGRPCLGTWPEGSVFRLDAPGQFAKLGRLGEEMEVMAMSVYNGDLYGGTLPSGQVYRYDGPEAGWTCTGQLDATPEVKYRRIWAMAVYQGKLFAGTLPSGHVYAMESGKCVGLDRALPGGWHHLAAVKAGGKLSLHVDGRRVAQSNDFIPAEYDLDNSQPLRIGLGEIDGFRGRMLDFRLYGRALDNDEIAALAKTTIDKPTEKQTFWRATADNPPAVTVETNPSEPTAFAAAELRKYLGQILGVESPDAQASPNAPVMHVSVDADAGLGDEGYLMRADGPTFHIIGGGPPGALYGVYEFLRLYAGCRFADLGPDGEYVPRKTAIEAAAAPLRRAPKLAYRGLQFSFYEDPELARRRIDWMAKNGMNYVMYRPSPDDSDPETVVGLDPRDGRERMPGKPAEVYWPFTKGWFDRVLRPEVRRRGLKLDMNHHNLCEYWLPPKRYFKEHPEWYALIDGRRGGKFLELGICTSKREAVATLIGNIRDFLRDNPEVKTLGVIPQDHCGQWPGMCQCDKCVALDPDPKDAFRKSDWSTGNRSKSFRYAKLLNEVAAALRGEFPDVSIGGEAYHDLVHPPRDVEIDPTTTIWFAASMRDGCRPIAAVAGSVVNERIYRWLEEWKKNYRGRLILYEYYMGLHARASMPYPISEVICRDWDALKKLGVAGATVQCWSSNHSVYVLNNLVFARCGWHDDVDHREVLDDYLLGAYGAAAEDVRPIFAGMLRAVSERAAAKAAFWPYSGRDIGPLLDAVGRDNIPAVLDAARRRAQNDRERRQVEKLSAAVRYWLWADEAYKLQGKLGGMKTSDPAGLRATLNRLLGEADLLFAAPETAGWISITARSCWKPFLADAACLQLNLQKEEISDTPSEKK